MSKRCFATSAEASARHLWIITMVTSSSSSKAADVKYVTLRSYSARRCVYCANESNDDEDDEYADCISTTRR